MYLNVNLTPPPAGGGEGACTTPKTPEILNSLINLTSPPLPQSFSQYQCQQVEGGPLVSPGSDHSSCSDDPTFNFVRVTDETFPSKCGGVVVGVGGGGGGLVGGSPGTSGMGGPLAGASPPSTPDLPSPLTTMEATKTALIKEGLKHQIRTKLQAAGLESPDAMIDDTKFIKNEEDEQLTEEDEERRRRRRERNKVAATKCRNKKKEKTIVLMSESETVEDINLRLKTEIKRLTSEKLKLEKLLGDPNHTSSCRHSPRCRKPLRPPLVIVTPADSPPDATSSSSSSSGSSSGSSTCSDSPTSPPLSISYQSPPAAPHPCTTTSSATFTPSSLTPSSSSSSSSQQFLAPKYSASPTMSHRHHPYQYGAGRSLPPDRPDPAHGCQVKAPYTYTGLPVPHTHEFIPPTPPSHKSVYTTPKSRGSSHVRYSPYGGRPQAGSSPLLPHALPQSSVLPCGTDAYVQNSSSNSGCGREDQQAFVTELHTNQFFPPCSYSSM